MATAEAGNLPLELVLPAERLAVVDQPPASTVARRMLLYGHSRVFATLVTSIFVAAAFERTLASALVTSLVFTCSWTLAVHVAERSLQTVQAAAGRFGMAAIGALSGAAVASGVSFWLRAVAEPRAEVVTMAALSFTIVLAAEVAKDRVAVLRPRVLLVGGGRSVLDLLEVLAYDDRNPFTVVGIVDDDSAASGIAGVPRLGDMHSLAAVVAMEKPDLVVVAQTRGRPEVFSCLASAASLGFRVVGLPEFCEQAFGRVPVRNVTDAWFMSVIHLYQRSYSRATKRAFDLVVALIGIVVAAPLFPLLAVLVRSTKGPVFYRQTRLGENGRPFSILKFRTMTVDAESTGAVWAAERDPRITRAGRLLRRVRLDELPQLINVLRGEMSIVGPRPERPEFHAMLEENVPFWSRRHLLKPGITGWAQVRAGYAADAQSTEEKLAYDLWYLRHQSLLVDFLICMRTLPSLFFATGR